MPHTDIQEIRDSIQRKYGALEDPSFSLVSKALSGRPYDPLVGKLRALFEVEETTDANDDVSFCYQLTKQDKRWGLELSMVGPYAVILRLLAPWRAKVVTPENAVAEEQKICVLLAEAGFKILERNILEIPIQLNLQNTNKGNVCLYQAPFTDIDILPWGRLKPSQLRKKIWSLLTIWIVGGLFFAYLAVKFSFWFILLLLALAIYLSISGNSVKYPNCGKQVNYNPIRLFGIEAWYYAPWVPQNCSECGYPL